MDRIIVGALIHLLLPISIRVSYASISLGQCNLSCNQNESVAKGLVYSGDGIEGRPGKMGPMGPKGDQGIKGDRGIQGPPGESCDCPHDADVIATIKRMQIKLNDLENRLKPFRSGWYRASNGLHYKYFGNETANYVTAKKRCATFNGRLAATGMRSARMRKEIRKILPNPLPTYPHIWIGLDELATKGVFIWADGVESTRNNTDWKPREPNNPEKACGALWGPANGNVIDHTCSYNFYYICEY